MSGYTIEWDKKVERFGMGVWDELKEEYDKVVGYSKKEYCNFFGKKSKNQIRKGNTQRLLKRGKIKDCRYTQHKGGLPRELKPKCWKDKHIVVNRKITLSKISELGR